MRWAVPWFLLMLLISNLFLYGSNAFYTLTLWLQLLGYGVIIAAHFSSRLQDIGIIKILYSFVQVNFAIAHATLAFIGGRRMTVWKPSKRISSP